MNAMIASGPLVTVGMPVLNGGQLFQLALESILRQTYRNLEVLISDNASTDETAEICCRYAAIDPRIRLVRQEHTIPGLSNFQFVHQHAHGRYFMWASHDDSWYPGFVEAGVEALERNQSAAAAMGVVRYLDKDGHEFLCHRPPYGLDSTDSTERAREYFRRHVTDNLLYALFRRDVLDAAPFILSTCPEKGIIMHAILQGAIVDAPGMEYTNRVSFKTKEEIAALFKLPSYSTRLQARVFSVVARELWRGLSIGGFLSVLPAFVVREQWHKWLIKAAGRALFARAK